jgi:hypothetical protein
MLTFSTDEFKDWPGAVSDGLTLPCSQCGAVPNFDYVVNDVFWRKVVPESDRLMVTCLPCLDALATAKGLSVYKHLRQIQFVGKLETISLVPAVTFTRTK